MVKTSDNYYIAPADFPFPITLPFTINVTAIDGQSFEDMIYNFNSEPTYGTHQFGDLGGKPSGEAIIAASDGDIVTPLTFLMLIALFIVMNM